LAISSYNYHDGWLSEINTKLGDDAMDTMTPSKIETLSEGQIAKVTDLVAAKLRKSGLPLKQSQEVLEQQGAEMADNFYADFRKRVESRSDVIVRRAKVNRKKTSSEAVIATGRNKYVADTVVDSMPVGEGYDWPDGWLFAGVCK
jgi:hypothetical protein